MRIEPPHTVALGMKFPVGEQWGTQSDRIVGKETAASKLAEGHSMTFTSKIRIYSESSRFLSGFLPSVAFAFVVYKKLSIFPLFSLTVYSHSFYYPPVEGGQSSTTQRSPPTSEGTPEEAAG